MRSLPAVEEAKRLFEEAKTWGVWRWLTEKRTARQTADAAWEALDQYENEVRGSWPADLQKAWHELEAMAAAEADGRARRSYEKAKADAQEVAPEVKATMRRLKEADAAAYQLRMDAEAQFEEADRRMNTDLARQGSQMALDAWTAREKYIRKMEALGRR